MTRIGENAILFHSSQQSLVSVLNPWMAFWANKVPINAPQPCLGHYFQSYRKHEHSQVWDARHGGHLRRYRQQLTQTLIVRLRQMHLIPNIWGSETPWPTFSDPPDTKYPFPRKKLLAVIVWQTWNVKLFGWANFPCLSRHNLTSSEITLCYYLESSRNWPAVTGVEKTYCWSKLDIYDPF